MEPNQRKILAVNFGFAYGGSWALRNINLAVREHSLLTIMGPTGSGKTTFLRSLNRLNDLVEGTSRTGNLYVDGVDVAEVRDVASLRRRVGMVFAMPTPLPMSIYENVAYGPKKIGNVSKKELDQLVEQALRDAALWDEVKDRLQSPGKALSGGQQQRLALARVLAVKPEIILLDEPTSGLDPLSTLRIEELMQELKNQYTIIFVTHNPQQAARLNSEVAFFYMGELVEMGHAKDLFTRPKDKRTEDYITGKVG